MTFGITGCERKQSMGEYAYEYVVGVSLTNVVEPWLSYFTDDLEGKFLLDGRTNVIIKDAAGNTEKQIQDIDALLECGIDLLIVAPGDEQGLSDEIEKIYQKIPVIVIGVEPNTDMYTSFLEFNDMQIGQMAGEYILQNKYNQGDQIVVFEGEVNSPISQNRLAGLQKILEEEVPIEDIYYLEGEWLRDKAENRMKDYLISHQRADIVIALNDEMSYGAYLAADQNRLKDITFIGVGGFDSEFGGLSLLKSGILDATIQCSGMEKMAYNTAMEILQGNEVEKNIIVESKILTYE
jgi:ABC-type sugar transport system substrate-binding protein